MSIDRNRRDLKHSTSSSSSSSSSAAPPPNDQPKAESRTGVWAHLPNKDSPPTRGAPPSTANSSAAHSKQDTKLDLKHVQASTKNDMPDHPSLDLQALQNQPVSQLLKQFFDENNSLDHNLLLRDIIFILHHPQKKELVQAVNARKSSLQKKSGDSLSTRELIFLANTVHYESDRNRDALDKALSYASQAHQKDPTDAYVCLCLGELKQITINESKEAIPYLEQAAAANMSLAHFYLARYYLEKCEDQPNFSKAVYYLTKAASIGHAYSSYVLACMYQHGYGVPQDTKQAIHYFEEAAANEMKQNSARAIFPLRICPTFKSMQHFPVQDVAAYFLSKAPQQIREAAYQEMVDRLKKKPLNADDQKAIDALFVSLANKSKSNSCSVAELVLLSEIYCWGFNNTPKSRPKALQYATAAHQQNQQDGWACYALGRALAAQEIRDATTAQIYLQEAAVKQIAQASHELALFSFSTELKHLRQAASLGSVNAMMSIFNAAPTTNRAHLLQAAKTGHPDALLEQCYDNYHYYIVPPYEKALLSVQASLALTDMPNNAQGRVLNWLVLQIHSKGDELLLQILQKNLNPPGKYKLKNLQLIFPTPFIETQILVAKLEPILRQQTYNLALSIKSIVPSIKSEFQHRLRAACGISAMEHGDFIPGIKLLRNIKPESLSPEENFNVGFHLFHFCLLDKSDLPVDHKQLADTLKKSFTAIERFPFTEKKLIELIDLLMNAAYQHLRFSAQAQDGNSDAKRFLINIACSQIEKQLKIKLPLEKIDYLYHLNMSFPKEGWANFIKEVTRQIGLTTTEDYKQNPHQIQRGPQHALDQTYRQLCQEMKYNQPAAQQKLVDLFYERHGIVIANPTEKQYLYDAKLEFPKSFAAFSAHALQLLHQHQVPLKFKHSHKHRLFSHFKEEKDIRITKALEHIEKLMQPLRDRLKELDEQAKKEEKLTRRELLSQDHIKYIITNIERFLSYHDSTTLNLTHYFVEDEIHKLALDSLLPEKEKILLHKALLEINDVIHDAKKANLAAPASRPALSLEVEDDPKDMKKSFKSS